jgi:hypothetical protein
MGFMRNEIILYQPDNSSMKLEVRLEDETVWLTQAQIVALFQSSKANISEHIKNIFRTGELDKKSTVRKFRTVQIEGGRKVERNIIHYNLDVIISVGYRVNSIRGTQFRIWANKILKDYLLKGYSLNKRLNRIEEDVQELNKKVQSIDLQIQANLPPKRGIFFEGEIFDAYLFVSDLIKRAEKSIILIDNYVDETVLTLFSKNQNANVVIYTKNISKQLKLDLEKYNLQYKPIEIKKFDLSHDRFLIVDKNKIYQFGASLKDLGKKWFAFSKFDAKTFDLLKRLEEQR